MKYSVRHWLKSCRCWVLCGMLSQLMVGCGEKMAGGGDPISVDELDRALAMWTMGRGSAPETWQMLTNLPALQGRPLPTPPAGKRIAFDAAKRHVILVEQ